MHNITTTTAAIFLPTIWSLDVLRATETALVLAPLVKRLDSQVKAKGQAITVPNVSNLVANAKQPNQTTQTQAITETGTTIYINKWYEARRKWSRKILSNQLGKPEMATHNKRKQLQRLNERNSINSYRISDSPNL